MAYVDGVMTTRTHLKLKEIVRFLTILALVVAAGLLIPAMAEEAPPAPAAPAPVSAPATNTDKGTAPASAAPASDSSTNAAPSTNATPASSEASEKKAEEPSSKGGEHKASASRKQYTLEELKDNEDIKNLVSENDTEIGVAFLHYIMQNLLPVVALITAAGAWISYTIVAHILALMVAPLRAGLARALAYGAAQAIISAVLVVVIFFVSQDLALYAITMGKSGSIGNNILVILAMAPFCLVCYVVVAFLVYEIPFGRAILFGILVFFGSGLVVGPVNFVLFTIFSPMLQADSSTPVFDVLAVKLAEENISLRDKLADKEKQLEKIKTETADVVKEKEQVEKALEAKKAKLAEAQKADSIAFALIGNLIDEGKRDQALAAYKEFAAKRSGEYVAFAQERIRELEAEDAAKVAAVEKARQDAEKAKADAEARFRSRLSSGEATLSEIRTRILGLSRDDVIALLGQPTERQADTFVYRRIRLTDSLTGDRRVLGVRFQSGVVLNVLYVD